MKSNRQIKPLIVIFVLILWIAGLLAAYYLYHKPIDLTLVSSILRIGWILINCRMDPLPRGWLGKLFGARRRNPQVELAFLQLALGWGFSPLLSLGIASESDSNYALFCGYSSSCRSRFCGARSSSGGMIG